MHVVLPVFGVAVPLRSEVHAHAHLVEALGTLRRRERVAVHSAAVHQVQLVNVDRAERGPLPNDVLVVRVQGLDSQLVASKRVLAIVHDRPVIVFGAH